MPTFEDYLRENLNRPIRPVTDHDFRVMVDEGGRLWFYVHPSNVDGITTNFRVEGNTLIPITFGA